MTRRGLRLPVPLALLAGAVMLAPWVHRVPLLDQDEPRFAECSRQMLTTGDWVYPQFNGKPRHAKPPLLNWVQAALYWACGVSEAAARLPSLLATVGIGLVVYLLSTAWLGREVGLLSLLVWFTLPQTHLWAKMSVADPLLTLLTTAALGFAFAGLSAEGRRRWRCYCLCGVAMGLGALTKGPVGVVVPALAYLLYVLLSRSFRRSLGHGGPWVALGLAVLIALPWYAAQVVHYGREYADTFFGFDHVQRYTRARDSLGPLGWLWPVPVVLLFAFPVGVALPSALLRALRRPQAPTDPPWADHFRRYLAAWVLAVVLLFAFSATRLPQYFMALYPAAAVLAADLLHRAAGRAPAERGWAMAAGVVGGGLLLAAAFAYGAVRAGEWAPRARLDDPRLMATVAGILAASFFCVGLAAGVGWRWAGRRGPIVGFLCAGLLVALVIGNVVWPAVGITRDEGLRNLAQFAGHAMAPDVPLVAYRLHTSTVVFYARRNCIELQKATPDLAWQTLHDHPGAWLILHRDRWPELLRRGLVGVATSGQYMLVEIPPAAVPSDVP